MDQVNYDDLELLPIKLIRKLLEKNEQIFICTSGKLRGKLKSVEVLRSTPHMTYWPGGNPPTQKSLCAQIIYIPAPRSRTREDPRKIRFSRVDAIFNMPVDLMSEGLFFKKIDDVWMLNINTSVKQVKVSEASA